MDDDRRESLRVLVFSVSLRADSGTATTWRSVGPDATGSVPGVRRVV